MHRDYITWLETLACNRKPQKVNTWMSALPEEIDLLCIEELQGSGISVLAKTVWCRAYGVC